MTKLKALAKDAGDKLRTCVAGRTRAEAWRQPVKGVIEGLDVIAQEVMNR